MHVVVEAIERHVHLSQEHLDILFGYGHKLTPRKYLRQPGMFLAAEDVTIIGPGGSVHANLIGPLRERTQVEITLSDCRALGLRAPIRVSGDLAGSGSCVLAGPCGELDLEEGVIVPRRHVHLTPEDALELHVSDGETLRVSVKSDGRSLTFEDVVARVAPEFVTCCHIDVDEANAAAVTRDTRGKVLL